MRAYFFNIIVLLLVLIPTSVMSDTAIRLKVTGPYLEFHTGPGRGFPVFHVVERNEWVEVIKKRTDWFKVTSGKEKSGWVKRSQLAQTRDTEGKQVIFPEATIADFSNRKWEMGALAGDFNGSRLLTIYGGYHFNSIFSAELSFSEALGNYSSSRVVSINLLSQPFPEWKISPFFSIGTGIVQVKPSATLTQEKDRIDNTSHVGIGARMYLSNRFFIRAEYKNHIIFTSRNDNEDISEWKLGFAFFY